MRNKRVKSIRRQLKYFERLGFQTYPYGPDTKYDVEWHRDKRGRLTGEGTLLMLSCHRKKMKELKRTYMRLSKVK